MDKKNLWLKDLMELKKVAYAQAIKEVAHEHNLNPDKLKEMLEASRKK